MAIDRTKIISKIQVNSTTYDVVTTKMVNVSGTFSASLPTLTKDETIVVSENLPKIKRYI